MRAAIYPGSFDPVTLGHMDIIERASALFDGLIVCVMDNSEKTPWLPAGVRVGLIKKAAAGLRNVTVCSFDGLLADFARERGVFTVIRGMRALTDFEFEFQMASVNCRIEPRLDTLFLVAEKEFTFVSSSVVRELIGLGADVDGLVPPAVIDAAVSVGA